MSLVPTTNAPGAAATGLLLFAHGSRDARWAEPFERLRATLAARGAHVALGYLECMTPDMAGAAALLAAQGCTRAVVVPIFLGQGGHVREDLPRLVAATATVHPGIALTLAPAIGEDADVIAAIADACLATRDR